MQKELTDVIYSILDKDWFPQVQSHNVLMLILWDKILCSNVQQIYGFLMIHTVMASFFMRLLSMPVNHA